MSTKGIHGDNRPVSMDRSRITLPSGGATLISQAEAGLPPYARPAFRKHVGDLLRPTLSPDISDVEQCIALALDLQRRKGAVA